MYILEERQEKEAKGSYNRGYCDALEKIARELSVLLKPDKKITDEMRIRRLGEYNTFLFGQGMANSTIGGYNDGYNFVLARVYDTLVEIYSPDFGLAGNSIQVAIPDIDPKLIKILDLDG